MTPVIACLRIDYTLFIVYNKDRRKREKAQNTNLMTGEYNEQTKKSDEGPQIFDKKHYRELQIPCPQRKKANDD